MLLLFAFDASVIITAMPGFGPVVVDPRPRAVGAPGTDVLGTEQTILLHAACDDGASSAFDGMVCLVFCPVSPSILYKQKQIDRM